LTCSTELVINYTSSTNANEPILVKEVNKMMEFLMTMGVIALVFITATFLVAIVAGGILRLKNGIFNRGEKAVVPEQFTE
jgi:hypothetical protein